MVREKLGEMKASLIARAEDFVCCTDVEGWEKELKGRGQGATRISQHKLIKHSNSDDLSMAIDNPIKFIGVIETMRRIRSSFRP